MLDYILNYHKISKDLDLEIDYRDHPIDVLHEFQGNENQIDYEY